MKNLIETYWVALIASLLVTTFVTYAVVTVINLTDAGLIHWGK